MVARSHYRDIAYGQDPDTGFLQLVQYPSITVYEPGTTTPLAQTLYAARSGGTTLANPFTGDQYGTVEFWLATPQSVRLVVTGVGIGSVTLDYEATITNPDDLISTAGGKTIDGTLLIAPSSGEAAGGMGVQSTGRVGFLDSATVDLSAASTPFSVTRTDALNNVLADFQYRNSFRGTAVIGDASTSITADAGGSTTTLVDATYNFATANGGNSVAGCILEITGGSGYSSTDKYRYISSVGGSGNHTITVSLELPGATDATTTYRIWQPGDVGAMRVLMEAKADQVAARRAIELHAFGQLGAPDTGIQAGEISIGSKTAQWDDRNNVALSIRASEAWLTDLSGGVDPTRGGVEQGIGIRFWGLLGWKNYWTAENAAGTYELKARKGGHMEMAGRLTVGSITPGSAALDVTQVGNTADTAFRSFKYGDASKYGAAYVGTDDTFNLASVSSGVGAGFLRLGNAANDILLQGTAATSAGTRTGDLLVLRWDTGATKFQIDKDGYALVGGNTVLKGRQTGWAAISGTAGGTYGATEQTMLNDIKAALNLARSAFNTSGHGAVTTV